MLKPLLEEFLKVEGVSAAVVVGRDGFVIESAVSGKVDIEALGAMASTGLGTSEAMGNTLGKGELSQMLSSWKKAPLSFHHSRRTNSLHSWRIQRPMLEEYGMNSRRIKNGSLLPCNLILSIL